MTKLYTVTKNKKLLDESGRHLLNLEIKKEIFEYLYHIYKKESVRIKGLYYYHNVIHKIKFRWCTIYYTEYHTIVFRDSNPDEETHNIYGKFYSFRYGSFDIISADEYAFIEGYPTLVKDVKPGDVEIIPGPFANFFVEVSPEKGVSVEETKNIIAEEIPDWAEIEISLVPLPPDGDPFSPLVYRFTSNAIMNVSWMKSLIAKFPAKIGAKMFPSVLPRLVFHEESHFNRLITNINNKAKMFNPVGVKLIDDTHFNHTFDIRFNRIDDTITIFKMNGLDFSCNSLYCKSIVEFGGDYWFLEHGKDQLDVKCPPGFRVYIPLKTTTLVPLFSTDEARQEFVYPRSLVFVVDKDSPGSDNVKSPDNMFGEFEWRHVIGLPRNFPDDDTEEGAVVLFGGMYYYRVVAEGNVWLDLNRRFYQVDPRRRGD